MSEAVRLATTLCHLVDVLIPGEGDEWPAASLAGVQGLLGLRLQEERGEDAVRELAAALDRCGGPLDPLDEAGRVVVVGRLEREEPTLFTLVRNAAFLAYYESPAVIPAVQALGQPYRAVPYLGGYPLEPFDPGRDRPRHNRGSYVPTDEVRPADLSGLDHLEGGSSDGRA